MTRCVARALVLVNWKGVFYERYLLDRHVTALEGANGAGKTTVMIAAYVALLPDLSKLRFTNVGETGATGGDRGIWGRLGEGGRPSYTVLQLVLPEGRSLLVGIELERKAEPTLELTPFMIESLDPSIRLQQLLLHRSEQHDEIPTLPQIRERAKQLGANVTTFGSVKDYFTTLFDLGITPMRLAEEEPRQKFSEMLRTSMTGGISRALTSQLRSFVLKQESGLSDTLARVRSNLGACGRTRTEVTEARLLEHEMSGIHDAASHMLTAAFGAVQRSTREQARSAEASRRRHEDAIAELRRVEDATASAEVRQSELTGRLGHARKTLEDARARPDQIARALTLQASVTTLAIELAAATEDAAERRRDHAQAAEDRTAARARLAEAQAELVRSAQGLADLQAGLDELHRKAHGHRLASAKLEELRELLQVPQFDVGEITLHRRALLEALESIDRELARRDRERSCAAMKRQDQRVAVAVLERIAQRPVEGDTHGFATAQLRRLRGLEDLAAQLGALRRTHDELCRHGERHLEIRRQLTLLGLGDLPWDGPSLLDRLSGLESTIAAATEEERQAEWQARDAAHTAETLRVQLVDLEARAALAGRLQAATSCLERWGGPFPRTRAALDEQRERLVREQFVVRSRVEVLTRERTQALDAAAKLEASHAEGPSPALLELRERLNAEFLVERYEETDPNEAGHIEAILGPLVEALVVEDPDAAAALLDKGSRPKGAEGGGTELDHVWLIAATADPLADARVRPELGQSDLICVVTTSGLRVSRRPLRPSLGQRARQQRCVELRDAAHAIEENLEVLESEVRRLQEPLEAIERLELGFAVWQQGDPTTSLATLESKRADYAGLGERSLRTAEQARETAKTARTQANALRGLLLEFGGHRDDSPERAADIRAALDIAEAAQAELERTVDDRRSLLEAIDGLRLAAPDDALLATWDQERDALERTRDRHFATLAALDTLEQFAWGLAWSDAERILRDQSELGPALRHQHEQAAVNIEIAKHELERIELAWELATATKQQSEAHLEVIRTHHRRAQHEFERERTPDATPEALQAAHAELAEFGDRVTALTAEEREQTTQLALLRDHAARVHRTIAEAAEALQRDQAAARAFRTIWEDLQRQAHEGGITLPEPPSDDERSSVDLEPEARSQFSLLVDRLRAARGGSELIGPIEATFRGTDRTATNALGVWFLVRDGLKNRLPAHITLDEDPLAGLRRLRDDLRRLETRLLRQEEDLRGNSEDIARGIDVQIRRATHQVKQLNRSLSGVGFGSIASIRICIERVESMETVLTALRDGSAQQLLFHSKMSIEDAMDEIFRRYGGGGRAGAQRILDYREYIDLRVEVKRRSSPDWEPANPTRVSTGEAIGIGAALAMVILSEWERDARLLRAQRSTGCLRFLFLDEANRLSQDNLAVLFDLCEQLDLQLLIAAPEVAHAQGNTTYRLVRRQLEDGREEVWVSGRRSSAERADEPQPEN